MATIQVDSKIAEGAKQHAGTLIAEKLGDGKTRSGYQRFREGERADG